jgi:vacuolar-type H+-ATPase subunit I/STV1
VPAHEPTDLDAVVDALYTKPLDEFIAARDAAVRQTADGGDRLGAERVKRLPKPSVAAWVINHVAREHPEEIGALADLGDELRSATQDRDRGRIRALDHLRRERTEALVRTVREAGEVGGRTVSAAVLDRLTETLTAAVMDPDAAAVVRAGRLSRALQHVGFGIVDEQGEEAELVTLHVVRDGAGDATDAEEPETAAGPEEADPHEADPHEAVAETDLTAAERAVDETSAHVDELEERRDEVRERIRTADAAVEQGQDEVEHLDQELERLTAERDAARQAVDEAREAADEARADLTAVEDELDDAVERAAEARRRRRAARGR